MFPAATLDLAQRVLATAREKNIRIATAESCTGGLIAATLTEIAGSSDVVEAGFTVYANDAKTRLLGVPPETIADYGAVSEDVARAMAQAALDRSGAHLSVAVTGIAGPGGGTALKPVGLVHLAAARIGHAIQHQECRFGDIGRSEVRMRTVDAALKLLLRMM